MKKKFDILRWRDEDANESCTFQCSQGTSGHQPNDEIKSIYEHNGVLDKIHSAKHIGAPNVASGCHRREHTVCAYSARYQEKDTANMLQWAEEAANTIGARNDGGDYTRTAKR